MAPEIPGGGKNAPALPFPGEGGKAGAVAGGFYLRFPGQGIVNFLSTAVAMYLILIQLLYEYGTSYVNSGGCTCGRYRAIDIKRQSVNILDRIVL